MTTAITENRANERALGALIAIAGAKLLFHALTGGQYGFHRDELATLDDARYLDWGYVAYPPFTPFVGRVALTLFGPSVGGVRLFAALAMSACVVLAGLIARELGGRRAAQIGAALAVAIGPVVLAASALFQYVAFDFLWWAVIAYGLVRLVNTHDARWWLLIGSAIGLGVQTKYTIGLCVIGVVTGVLLTRRDDLRSKWLWAGVALSILIALPNLVWQARHEFISVEFLKSIHERDVRIGRTAGFLADQFKVAANPLMAPLWILGAVTLLRGWKRPRERLLVCYVFVPLVLLVLLEGRGYYAAPLYPPLLAMGTVRMEAWIASLGGIARRAARAAQVGLFALGSCVAVIVLPVTPPGSPIWRLALQQNPDLAEEIGWPELAQTVATVYKALPPAERATTRVLTGNYGEAGAINLYGPALGLPEAISRVNSYWYRGYGDPPPETLIVLGIDRADAEEAFESCAVVALVPNPLGVRNEETTRHPEILLCRRLAVPWTLFWRSRPHFG